jgi:hypothetical protein
MGQTNKTNRAEKKKKKGWFARLVERIAKENEKSGGKVCST